MIDVMKQALEALENHSGNYKLSKIECVHHNAAVETLRQAIEQAEKQEPDTPLVSIGVDVTAQGATVVGFYRRPNAVCEMFYSEFHPSPRKDWVGLTDEERCTFVSWLNYKTVNEIFDAIEALLKERNT
jgi:hypothetical protein